MPNRAPENITRETVYRPDWELPYQLFLPEKYYEEVKELLLDPDLPDTGIFHTKEYNDSTVVVFGSPVPEDNAKIITWFGKASEPTVVDNYTYGPAEYGGNRIMEVRSYKPPQEPSKSSIKLKYPFDELKNVGDHFLVVGGNKATIAVYASNYTKYVEPKKMITVREVSSGVLVLLLDGPEAQFKRTIRP